jgi:hypothetical protein
MSTPTTTPKPKLPSLKDLPSATPVFTSLPKQDNPPEQETPPPRPRSHIRYERELMAIDGLISESQIINKAVIAETAREKEEDLLQLSPKPSPPKSSPPRSTSPPFTKTSIFNPRKRDSRFDEILSKASPTPSPSKPSNPPFRNPFQLLHTVKLMKPDLIFPPDCDDDD